MNSWKQAFSKGLIVASSLFVMVTTLSVNSQIANLEPTRSENPVFF